MTSPKPWRKSTFSSATNSCVELCRDADGNVYVRNSNNPDAGTLTATGPEIAAWFAGCAAGHIDDLT